jgi:hypothetical protein
MCKDQRQNVQNIDYRIHNIPGLYESVSVASENRTDT